MTPEIQKLRDSLAEAQGTGCIVNTLKPQELTDEFLSAQYPTSRRDTKACIVHNFKYGFDCGYDAGETKAKKLEVIGDGLWKALEAVAHKLTDRGSQRFAISELNTYKQMLAKIKGET